MQAIRTRAVRDGDDYVIDGTKQWITNSVEGNVLAVLVKTDIDAEPRMYPRHFGVTFRARADFDAVLDRARSRDLPFFKEPFVRFGGRREEHETFFLRDPSNNLLEFKHYVEPECMY